MSNGIIHIQRSFREFARTLDKFWLVESCFLDTLSSEGTYIALWKVIVRWSSTVRCICLHWDKYQKINFQPIRTCLMYARIREWPLDMYHSVGHVSPCIVWVRSQEGAVSEILDMICLLLIIISSPEPTAHRWAYSIGRHPSSVRPSVRPSSVVRRRRPSSTFSNDISSEAMKPILAIFHI